MESSSDMSMAFMCAYPSSKYALTHFKCVLSCCEQCSRIDIPSQESNQHNLDVSPKISFHIYNIICTLYSAWKTPF